MPNACGQYCDPAKLGFKWRLSYLDSKRGVAQKLFVLRAYSLNFNFSIDVRLRKLAFMSVHHDGRVWPVRNVSFDVANDATDINLFRRILSISTTVPFGAEVAAS
jgi:hypothetical protein